MAIGIPTIMYKELTNLFYQQCALCDLYISLMISAIITYFITCLLENRFFLLIDK